MQNEISRGIKAIFIILIIIILILVFWNFSLSKNSIKINDKIKIIEGMDDRINNIFNFLAFFWLEKYNLLDYDWLNKYNCTEYREIPNFNRQLDIISDEYIKAKIIIGDDLYSVFYWNDKEMICNSKNMEIDCEQIFCV